MIIISLLLLLALIFFALYTLNIPSGPRFNWLGAGLFCWCLWVALGGHALYLATR